MRACEFINEEIKKPRNNPRFTNFFKNSKVKQLVYHASKNDFTEFNTELSDLGAHFGTLDQANHRANTFASHYPMHVMPCWINVTNPLRLKDTGTFHAHGIANQLEKKGLLPRGEGKRIESEIDKNWKLQKKYDPYLKKIIMDAGYDGVVYKNEHEGSGDSYIVFSPNQIKSAIGNIGNYDSTDPSIIKENADQVETQQFKAWFGNSKMIDNSGKPLTLYHGTDVDFTKFNPSKRGLFGTGIYLANTPDGASEYASDDAGRVLPVYVSIKNPFYTIADYNYAEEKYDIDSPACRMIDELLDDASSFINILRKDHYGSFGLEAQKILRKRGYDGIVVDWQDGTKYVIAFSPNQIKSAIGNSGEYNTDDPSIIKESSLFTRSSEPLAAVNPKLNRLQRLVESNINEIGYSNSIQPLEWTPEFADKLQPLEILDGLQISGFGFGNLTIVGIFTDGKPDVYVVFETKTKNLRQIENVSRKAGQLTVLLKCILARLGTLHIPAHEPMTSHGMKWIAKIAETSPSFSVTDNSGNKLSGADIEKSWHDAFDSGNSNDLSITLSSKRVTEDILRNMLRHLPQHSGNLLLPPLTDNGNKRLP